MTVNPAQLSIVLYPDPVLREPTRDVDPMDPNVQEVARRMIEIMFQAEGAGLAAPQVGLNWRLFVTRDPMDEQGGLAWMNPVLEIPPGVPTEPDIEGCLSLPGIEVLVQRPSLVQLRAFDLQGQPVTCDDEQLARVFQHEFDHLEGVLIIDKMTAMERIRNRKLIKDLNRAARGV